MQSGDLLVDGTINSPLTLILAHGAGTPMDSSFMSTFAAAIAASNYRVIRFEFPYMQKRRQDGRRRPPDRLPNMLDHYRAVINMIGNTDRLVIGGKSMGGRVASMVADTTSIAGLICLGYPFHSPRKPDCPRIEHLKQLRTPALIIQGTRDPFGSKKTVDKYKFSKEISVCWIEDGDHSFKPRKTSGRTEAENCADGIRAITEFLDELIMDHA